MKDLIKSRYVWIDLFLSVDSMRAACTLSNDFEFNYDTEFGTDDQIRQLCYDWNGFDQFLEDNPDDSITKQMLDFMELHDLSGYLVKLSAALPTKMAALAPDEYDTDFGGWSETISVWHWIEFFNTDLLESAMEQLHLSALKLYMEKTNVSHDH